MMTRGRFELEEMERLPEHSGYLTDDTCMNIGFRMVLNGQLHRFTYYGKDGKKMMDVGHIDGQKEMRLFNE